MPAPSQRRRKGPTLREWGAIQRKFTRLYLQEAPRLSLSEIKEILAQDDGFHAELHSYKLRVKQWDICRNLKASEKEGIAHEVSAYLAQGLQAPPRLIHQRPARLDKVARHVRRRNQLSKAHEDVEKNSLLSQSTDCSPLREVSSGFNQQRAILDLQRSQPGPQLQLDSAEVALHAVKDWHRWHFRTQPLPDYTGEHDYVAGGGSIGGTAWEHAHVDHHWGIPIMAGLNSLDHGLRVDVYASFNHGCERFLAALSCQPVDLIMRILNAFCFRDWQSYPDFKVCIQEHLLAMARLKLGLRHPLTLFLQCLRRGNDSTPPGWSRMALALIGDLFTVSAWSAREEFFQAYSQLCVASVESHDSFTNTSLITRLKARASQVLGKHHRTTTLVKYLWCRSLTAAGDIHNARLFLLGMLGLSDDEALIDAIDELSWQASADPYLVYYGLEWLSSIAWDLRLFQQSMACERKCLQWALSNKIGGQPEVIIHLNNLQESLITTRNWPQLASLRGQFPDLHQMLPDRTRLFEIPDHDTEPGD